MPPKYSPAEEQDWLLSAYDYPLPEGAIAQEPPSSRGNSRLLVLERSGATRLASFPDLAAHLPPGALLIANNSKVVPARLFGRCPQDKTAEFLLLTPLPLLRAETRQGETCAHAEGLLRGARRFKSGTRLEFTPNLSFILHETREFGRVSGTLCWRQDLQSEMHKCGEPPLPPYIKRKPGSEDVRRYQTVYAADSQAGSVAAPTAGLHFTAEHIAALKAAGFGWAEVTLHVGYGTFSPIRCEDIREHAMHAEYVTVPEATAQAVARAKAEGRPVVALGTTVVRTLEGGWLETGGVAPYSGWVNLFIQPGFRFRVVDKLLTNFHLPRSSLLVLVSALAGRERVLDAYGHALAAGFRVFSYGDAMLVL